jgi:hyaluronan synthase
VEEVLAAGQPVAACSFVALAAGGVPFMLIATAVGLLSPIVLASSLVIAPVMTGMLPITYVAGVVLVAVAYGFFHRTLSDDRRWIWAIFGTVFYLAFSAQIFWALAKVRDGKWGTRGV